MVDTIDNTILSTASSYNPSPDYLFVYGTLQPSFDNVFAQYLRQHSRYLGNGTFPGFLLDLGQYPGAIYQPGSKRQVTGSVYEIERNKLHLLSYLDDYEGIGEQYAQPDEYRRAIVSVSYNGSLIECWSYLYNLLVTNQTQIKSGNYKLYLDHPPA